MPGDEIVRIDGTDIGADLAGAIAQHARRLRQHRDPEHPPRRDSPGCWSSRCAAPRSRCTASPQQTLEPGYGYVRITSFSETTARGPRSRPYCALKRDNPAGIKGLVLDLRNNPGGVLEAGVAVADDFLDSGVIVTADGRTPEARFRMDATPGDLIDGAPLVVLVNGGSASASEIVAGALKDHGARAARSDGAPTARARCRPSCRFSHGGAVKLTTSRYFTPSGASIQGKGLVPDILEEGAGRRRRRSSPASAPPLTAARCRRARRRSRRSSSECPLRAPPAHAAAHAGALKLAALTARPWRAPVFCCAYARLAH